MKRNKTSKLAYVILALAVVFLMLPFLATIIYSFTVGWTKLLPSGWTLK
jgi:ABC-type spermidine/putrescine transport system permease subunit II